MKKEDILKAFPDYEEITQLEYEQLPYSYGCYVLTITKDSAEGIMKDLCLYFKPKQKFPIVFAEDMIRLEVFDCGNIKLLSKGINEKYNYIHTFSYNDLELLYKAIAKSKEIRGLK